MSFWSQNWGNVASVLGLLVSIVGFLYTIAGVRKTKDAATRAEQAANKTKETIIRSDTIANCSAALNMMEEIKRLHRDGDWKTCLERYSPLQRTLLDIKSAKGFFSEDDQTLIQSAITQISEVEAKVEKALESQKPVSAARMNEVMTKQLEKLHTLQMKVKQQY